MDFRYVLGEKDDALLILFYGKMGGRELVELEKCKLEVMQKPQKFFIVNFRDVKNVMPAVHTFLAKFQMEVRESGKFIALCGLSPDVKLSLLSAGIIRENEIFNNIPDAWNALNKFKNYQQATQQNAKKAA